MKRSTCFKLVGTLGVTAVVLGAIIVFTTGTSSDSAVSRFLQSGVEAEVEREFNKFTAKYYKSYLTKAEYTARLQAFKRNYETVRSHNSISQPFQLAINDFSDWTIEEYGSMLTNLTVPENATILQSWINDDNEDDPATGDTDHNETENVTLSAPVSVDWRN